MALITHQLKYSQTPVGRDSLSQHARLADTIYLHRFSFSSI